MDFLLPMLHPPDTEVQSILIHLTGVLMEEIQVQLASQPQCQPKGPKDTDAENAVHVLHVDFSLRLLS